MTVPSCYSVAVILILQFVLNDAFQQPDDSAFLFGGLDSLQLVEKYDFSTSTWSRKADIPDPGGYGLVVSSFRGIGYVCGFQSDPYRLDLFHFTSNKWVSGPDSSRIHEGGAAATLGGKIYVVGGGLLSYDQLSTEIFDPNVNSWRLVANMNTKRRRLSVATLGDTLYAIGGCSGDGGQSCTTVASVEAYNITSNTWSYVLSMNRKRIDFCAEVVGGKVYVMGGDDGKALKSVEVYDPIENMWTLLKDMIDPRFGATSIVRDCLIYVFGGSSGGGTPLDDVIDVYDPVLDAWTRLPDKMPNERYFAQAIFSNDTNSCKKRLIK